MSGAMIFETKDQREPRKARDKREKRLLSKEAKG
jgi:hypothetical protein